jgi:uncharacterized protein DUF4157
MALLLMFKPQSQKTVSRKLVPRSSLERNASDSQSRFDWPARLTRRTAAPIQSRLQVGEPNNKFEQEADRMADLVMRMPERSARDAPSPNKRSVQGVGADMSVLQTSSDRGAAEELSPEVGSETKALTGGGRPIPQTLRAFFEPRFGYDFSRVRVHPDAHAVASAVQARAFTVGQNIGFDRGQYAANTDRGKWLLAHELTHVIQQERALPYDRLIQRKSDGAKVPKYQDCSAATTLTNTPNPELESARRRAVDFVNGAICKLAVEPDEKDKSYRLALERHFINPSAVERKNIRATYRKILDQLEPEKIRCVAAQKDKDYCSTDSDAGKMAGFNRSGETFLCESFWTMNHKCRAMTLIHEAAHAVGIGAATPHPPYRGSTEYPFGAGPPGAGQSTVLRMDNPDAYSFFAAHVWREIDTECHIFVGIPETIEITGSAPNPATTP